ncbi:6155_t:CDS:2 [Funneliformis caledonium]|uniref:6155_t:CDS:1 n=1 Tax=Funneliformis caledonium TaxID=1117310 RepID=A0A9N9EW37_9GLOM|nr:6155_t:CDS:2 [Funneliformis caledonium]
MVFYFVLGEAPATENHFVVDITDKIKTISHLQQAIKDVKQPHLDDFSLNDLKLWKVYIPIIAEEWAVVDIRNSKMGPPDQYGKDDIYALCDENFESIHLIYPDRTEQVVKFLGEECIENSLGIDISEFLSYEGMEID